MMAAPPPPPPPPPPPGPPPVAAAAATGSKTGEEKMKEMEAEMALFEQEVLGAPVSTPAVTAAAETVPVALIPVPVARPIIGTNTYRQIQQSLEARAAAAATVMPPVLGPPSPFVGPAMPPPRQAPIIRPVFVPHVLQRPAGPRIPPMRPPPPPPLMGPPMRTPPPLMMGHPMAPPPPMGPMHPVRYTNVNQLPPLMPVHPPVMQPVPKVNLTIIQAAPTVYRPPVVKPKEVEIPEPHLPPLLEDKDQMTMDDSLIGPTLPEVEPPHVEVGEVIAEDKKKSKQERTKRCIRTAAGISWEDPSLLEWEHDDFRIFCGDLGNEVNDDILARAFSKYQSFLKAKVIRDKRTGKTKGYGFVSFKDPNDYVRAMREMNGKYVGSRPIKLRKSMWRDRNLDVVRKKQKEKKKLGLR
ncbi:RNA-binding protein 42 isoform X2 [Scyliorhinus torazame]|uniref:RNA-binding protein 42 isoform X2 n=1 Tax=Scyliorhinus torazame TaxID=75743 RepID=UPI003B5BCA49